MKIIFIILGCICLLLIVLPILFDYYLMYRYRLSDEVTRKLENEKGVLGNYDELKKIPFDITSYDGYVLHGEYIPAEQETDKYMIISHGYTYTRYGSVKYMQMFRSMGFSCIIYDNRGHGKNKPAKCTFGLRESRDLLCVIDAVKQKFGESIILGLHGESMGSGIEISAMKYHPKVDFVINDCGYGVLSDVLEHKIKQRLHLSKWFLRYLDFFAKLVFGYSYYEVRPIDCLEGNKIPICFIHGKDDQFINCAQSEAMYEKTEGYREIHLFDGADHAQSIEKDKERYYRIVGNFLNKVL